MSALQRIWICGELYELHYKFQEKKTKKPLAMFKLPGAHKMIDIPIYHAILSPLPSYVDPKTEHFSIKKIVEEYTATNGQLEFRVVLKPNAAQLNIFKPSDIDMVLNKLPGREISSYPGSSADMVLIPEAPSAPEKPNAESIDLSGGESIDLSECEYADKSTASTPAKKTAPRKKTISKVLREKVWMKHNGRKLDGRCYCCQKVITTNEFECGHVVPESKGGKTTLPNLEPICRTCNRSMGTRNMHEFMSEFRSKATSEFADMYLD